MAAGSKICGMLNDLRALRSPSKYESAFTDCTAATCGERSEFNLHQDKVQQVQADAIQVDAIRRSVDEIRSSVDDIRTTVDSLLQRTGPKVYSEMTGPFLKEEQSEDDAAVAHYMFDKMPKPTPIHGKAYNILVVGACESEDKAYQVCIEMSKPNLKEDLKAYNILVVGACELEDKAYYVFDEMPSQTPIEDEEACYVLAKVPQLIPGDVIDIKEETSAKMVECGEVVSEKPALIQELVNEELVGEVAYKVFDETPKSVSAGKGSNDVVPLEIALLQPGGYLKLIELGLQDRVKDIAELKEVSSFNIPSMSKFEEEFLFVDIKNYEFDIDCWHNGVLMFIFDPGGRFSPKLGCDFIDLNGVKQDLDKMPSNSFVELLVGKVFLFVFDPGGVRIRGKTWPKVATVIVLVPLMVALRVAAAKLLFLVALRVVAFDAHATEVTFGRMEKSCTLLVHFDKSSHAIANEIKEALEGNDVPAKVDANDDHELMPILTSKTVFDKAITLENFVWDPGLCHFMHTILGDKDVFEGKEERWEAKKIMGYDNRLSRDTTMVIMRRNEENEDSWMMIMRRNEENEDSWRAKPFVHIFCYLLCFLFFSFIEICFCFVSFPFP